jgi:mannose-6-phosphate isomerase-like protein (cupin superfamily)
MEVIPAAARHLASGAPPDWVEHLRVTDLSVGTYSLPAGAVDDQVPHSEDEVYVVLRGTARFTGAGATAPVQAGTTIYVPAGEEHRFTDITEDLVAVVVFAPAEGTR